MAESLSSLQEDVARPEEGRRSDRVVKIVFALFCVEIGLILLALPWTLLWDNNFFFSLLGAEMRDVWMSSYTRGAVSGLGVVNLWIAAHEARRLSRSS